MLNQHLIARTRPQANPENMILWKNKRITLLTEALFRVEENDTCQFCDAATQTVWFRDAATVKHTVAVAEDECIISTAAAELHVRAVLADSYVMLADGRRGKLSNEGNLKGTYRTLDCCDGDYFMALWGDEKPRTIELENGVLSRSGIAVFDDSKSLLLKADGTVTPRKVQETDLYVFAYGDRYREAIQGLYQISGAPAVIPRHALGNWWSRYWAYSQQEYLDLMDEFEEQGLPFTVATVDMDWHPSENLPDGESGWTGYTWNKELFPDYRKFLKALQDRALHVTLNLHPALGVRWFEAQYPEMARRMGIDPATKQPVSFDPTSEDFINAYFEVLHKPYERDGVDFWWIDWQQGQKTAMEGLDPLWSLNHYHTLDIGREKDALILSRYAGIGSHRYPLGFSGDTFVTWASLDHIVGFTSKASNAGYSWWSHDIGGHMMGYKDNELFVRFVQFGVFSPINRLHSSKSTAITKEITSYTGGTGLIAREYLRLRHALLPMLYTASCETAEQGLALIEPMYYQYPGQVEAYECEGQYLFARQMIAAPITEKSGKDGLTKKRVWLPDGQWTDFFTGDCYQGGRWTEMLRPLDSFPLLAREGAFVVLDGAIRGNSTALPEVLDVHAFSGNGAYTLVEDAGEKRACTRFASAAEEGKQIITVCADDPEHILPQRKIKLRLRNLLNGSVQVTADGEEMAVSVRRMRNYTVVTLSECRPGVVYRIAATEEADVAAQRNEAITRIVMQAEGGNDMRDKLIRDLCGCEDGADRQQLIRKSELADQWKERLMEVAAE